MSRPTDVNVREQVRSRYAEAATVAAEQTDGPGPGCCPGSAAATTEQCCGSPDAFGATLYEDVDQRSIPEAAVLASLGCGNPIAVAELRPGETVLDLGSGGGIDVLLSAKRVGPRGKVYGVDMTDEMLALAERNRVQAGVDNVEFLKGYIEAVPLPDACIDVIISNCVINLSTDKEKVFGEMFRLLRAGGRIGITDVVADDALGREEIAERGSFVGCIAGALSSTQYETGLRRAGFDDVGLRPTHEVAPQMFSAIVRATKP